MATSEAASAGTAAAWRRRMRDQVCPAIRSQIACQANQVGRPAASSAPSAAQHGSVLSPHLAHGPVLSSPRLAHRPATESVEGGISSQRLRDCPPAYATVLRLLREAEASGAWPGTRLGLGLGLGLGLRLGSGLGLGVELGLGPRARARTRVASEAPRYTRATPVTT